MMGGTKKNLNLKKVTNENISICLCSLNGDGEPNNDNLLETKVKITPYYTNSHFFLMQFFEGFFSFMPTFVYYNDQHVLYFLPFKRNRLINAKYSSKKITFCRKFTKNIHFVNYDEPVQLVTLITNLFQHVHFHFLEYTIEGSNKKFISIKMFFKESQLKFALGRKGSYIKTVNDLFHTFLDQRITLFIRSLGV